MEGDKLIIKEEHGRVARMVADAIEPAIRKTTRYTVSVGGESGAGKSEIASELARTLRQRGIPTGILQMDDYFIFPSRTCHEMRTRNVEQVGMYEAKLDFLECNLRSFKRGDPDIYKPLSIYQENRLTTEVMDLTGLHVLIAEGTYTTTLDFVDCHVFIDRDYRDTRKDRETRARDILDSLMADILERDHRIISAQRNLAQVIINRDFSGIQIVGDVTAR